MPPRTSMTTEQQQEGAADQRPRGNVARRNRRGAKRYQVALPVVFSRGNARTVNVSESGVLFETSETMTIGEHVVFTLIFGRDENRDRVHARCTGIIVRVEAQGDRTLAAVRITSYGF